MVESTPITLQYATPTVEPSIHRDAKELTVDLGRSSALELVTALTTTAFAIAYAVALLFTSALGTSDGVERFVVPPFLLVSSIGWVVRVVRLSRSREEPTVIVVDAETITLRGPRAVTAQWPTKRATRFGVRRRALPWMSELRVRGPAGKLSAGPWTTLVVAADRRNLRLVADELNALVGPPPTPTHAERRGRLRRRLAFGAVLFLSVSIAAGLVYAGFSLPYEQKRLANVLFGSAIAVVTLANAGFLISMDRQTSAPGPDRLHRNNAAEWTMVFSLTPIVWLVRAWQRVRRRPSSVTEDNRS